MNWSRRSTLTAPLLAAGCAGRRQHTAGALTRLYVGRFACDAPMAWVGSYQCSFELSPWLGFEASDAQLVRDKWREEQETTLRMQPKAGGPASYTTFIEGEVEGHPYQAWISDIESHLVEPFSSGRMLVETPDRAALLIGYRETGPETPEGLAKHFANRPSSLGVPGEGPGFYTPARKIGLEPHAGEYANLDAQAPGLDLTIEYGRVRGREYADSGAPRAGRVARLMAHMEPERSGVLTRLLWRRLARYGGLLGTEVAWIADDLPGGSINFAWSYRGPGGNKTGPFAFIDVFADLGRHERSEVRGSWFAMMDSFRYLGE